MKKICRICKQEKELDEFPKHKAYKDGHETQCKFCKKQKVLEKISKCDIPKEKFCKGCSELKPIETFNKNNALKDGYNYRCRECDKEAWAEYRKNNDSKIKRKYTERYHSDPEFRQHRLDIGKEVRERRKKEFPEKIILQSSKQRAREKNFEHNIELCDIVIPEFCPILGIKLESGGKGIQTFNSPSIDRIDSTKGYIKGNVRVISLRANMMKNDASLNDIKTFCNNILKYMNNEDIVQTIENKESIEPENKESLG